MGRKLVISLISILFFYMISPFLLPIAMSGVLAVLFTPTLAQLERKKIPLPLGAILLTTSITLGLLMPASFLIFFVAKTGIQQLQFWRSTSGTDSLLMSLMTQPQVHSLMLWLTTRLPLTMTELADALQDLTTSVGARLTDLLGGVFTHIPSMIMTVVMIVVSLYFFLIDGRQLVRFLKTHSVFSPLQTDRIISTLEEVCRSVIFASVVSGLLQTAVEILGCAVTSTPNIALIGALVFVGSFIPVVGSLPITLGVAIHQIIEGNEYAGITLCLIALIIIGIDNTVRPLFLKGTVNLHPLLAFIAAFGGLQTLGFLGIFLGPIIAALFVVVLQAFTQES
jgi:predicted PurR-regulated permease PerM